MELQLLYANDRNCANMAGKPSVEIIIVKISIQVPSVKTDVFR